MSCFAQQKAMKMMLCNFQILVSRSLAALTSVLVGHYLEATKKRRGGEVDWKCGSVARVVA